MNKIIAVDFDGTLCENKYPEIGKTRQEIVDNLIFEKFIMNSKIILWTCRTGKQLEEAVEWCKKQGLYFDAVNENLPEIVEAFGGDNRKICADEYWDDKAVNVNDFL